MKAAPAGNFDGNAVNATIAPGKRVLINRRPELGGKARFQGRTGTVERENSVAAGWWYIKLDLTKRAKESTELFHASDLEIT
jgi:hypothetical protein